MILSVIELFVIIINIKIDHAVYVYSFTYTNISVDTYTICDQSLKWDYVTVTRKVF